MTTALSSLSFSMNSTANWQATKTQTGFPNSLQNNNSPSKRITLGTAAANNVAGGADEVYASVQSISSSSSSTLVISNLTDVVNQTSLNFARLKYWRFQLLSIADDSTLGTACTSVAVGGAASHPFMFNLNGSTASTVSVNNGAMWEYGDPGAAGYVVTSSSNDQIKILNNDGVNAAAVLVVLVGGSS